MERVSVNEAGGAIRERLFPSRGCSSAGLAHLVALMSLLQSTLKLGALTLPNRIIMAPLTRCRASAGRVPNELMRDYYVQRASAGLILSEATAVDAIGVGYPDTPGIWSEAQVAGWAKITAAVRAAGGRIFLQLWHVGRVSDPVYLDGKLPVAPSAIAPSGHVSLIRPMKAFETPRALKREEISGVIEAFRRGAENAKLAGFDGVEIHGANGYLLDQFLQSSSNHRTDDYGGTVENRARFALEVTDAVVSVWGADRVGYHLAPRGMGDANLAETFGYLATELGRRKLAFLCAREGLAEPRLGPELKKIFGGVFVANQGFTAAEAETEIGAGHADAVAWGKLFIANPDLPRRFFEGAALNAPVPETFSGAGAVGYTDYPVLAS
jgi:2,4-dienoyl-CoA reductase-like NADH-dependent reductase (Old Yellow Enzyme family)